MHINTPLQSVDFIHILVKSSTIGILCDGPLGSCTFFAVFHLRAKSTSYIFINWLKKLAQKKKAGLTPAFF